MNTTRVFAFSLNAQSHLCMALYSHCLSVYRIESRDFVRLDLHSRKKCISSSSPKGNFTYNSETTGFKGILVGAQSSLPSLMEDLFELEICTRNPCTLLSV